MPTMTRATLLSTFAALVALAIAPRFVLAGEPLPRDPALVEGRLDNGLRYAIKARQDVQEAAVYLVVDVSPMDEAPDEIEASRLVGLLPLGATKQFPKDARSALLDELGPGGRIDSRVGFEGTWFVMDIPEPDQIRLERAIEFAADVISAPSFAKANIHTERDALLSIRAAATTPRTRAQAALFSGLKMDVDLGRRFLGAEKGEILALDAETLKRFHEEWYAPANCVLVVVGDVNVPNVQQIIAKAFESVESRPAPSRTPFGPLKPNMAPLLVEQPGLHVADTDIVCIELPRAPTDTLETLRARVAEGVIEDVIELRLAQAARNRDIEAEMARAWTFDMGRRFTLRNVYVRGEASDWRALAGALTDTMDSLRAAPIADDEFRLARDTRVARERRKIAAGDGADASDDARRIANAILAGDTPLAWSDAARLRIKILESLGAEAIAQRAGELFPPASGVMVLTTPPLEDAPSEGVLAEAFTSDDSHANLHAPVVEPDVVFAALAEPADGPGVEQIELQPAAGVLSAWLSNGVRIHHREMTGEPGLVRVSLAITGGRIDETPATHGLTDAATVLFRSPATDSLDASTLAGALDRTTIETSARAHEDLILVRASSVREDLPALLRVLTATLRDGKIDERAFERWQNERLDRARQERSTPYMAGAWAFAATAYEDAFVGVQMPSPEDIEAITAEATQKWLDELLAGAAIEVAIVGDIDRKSAIDLAGRWFGSLPTHQRVTEARLEGDRVIEFKRWPHRKTYALGADTDQGLALVGFHTMGRHNTDALKLQVAAAALSERLKRESRDAPELIEPLYAIAWTSDAYENHGFVASVGVTTAGDVEAIGDRLDKGLEWLLITGPDSIMLAEVAERVATDRERALASAETWAEKLARLDYHDKSITEMLEEPAQIRAFSANDIFAATRRSARASTIFKIIVKGGDDTESDDLADRR
jgi:zinc protease